jgi:hypothetical protein
MKILDFQETIGGDGAYLVGGTHGKLAVIGLHTSTLFNITLWFPILPDVLMTI